MLSRGQLYVLILVRAARTTNNRERATGVMLAANTFCKFFYGRELKCTRPMIEEMWRD